MDIKKKIIKRTKKIKKTTNDNKFNTFINKFTNIDFNDKILKECAIKIQKIFRGYVYRVKHLPIILYEIKNYLRKNINVLSNISKDGRINSILDEDKIINLIEKKFKNNIKIPKERNWFDIVIKDYYYGWIPINIKTSKCSTSDNTGNLAMCVYSYTNCDLELNLDKTYNNGEMSKILISKLEKKNIIK